MVVAGTDPGSVAKYRKTMNNQKRRIRRRHTVGGTKDFAEWEALINAENDRRAAAPAEAVAEKRAEVYADESIAGVLANQSQQATAVAAAASRIIQRSVFSSIFHICKRLDAKGH